MQPEAVLDIYGDAFYLIILLVTVIVLPSLIVGLMVSMFQAATQINEQTLSFLPRLIITLAVIALTGNWVVAKILDLFAFLFKNIPYLIG